MPLERTEDHLVRLVECPFCETDLSDTTPSSHLQRCKPFHTAYDGALA